jgi:hypothetical protein
MAETAFMGGQAGYDEAGNPIGTPAAAPTPAPKQAPLNIPGSMRNLGTTPSPIKAPSVIAPQPRPAPAPIPTPETMAGDQGFVQGLAGATPKDIPRLRAEQLSLGQKSAQEEYAAKTEQAQSVARGEKSRTELLQDMQKEQKAAIEQHKRDIQESSPFAPTQESAKDVAQLFSLITVAAFGSGGKGKYAGMQTLASLTGAMKGYQAGQKDVYEKDIKAFEENLKVMKTHNDKVNALYEDAMKLMATNKELGLQKIQEISATDNTGIITRLARSGQYKALGEALNTVTTALQAAQDKIDKRNQEFALLEQRFKNEKTLEQSKFQHGLELAEKKANSKSAADRYGFGDIVAGASNEAAAALKNLMGLPIDSTAGFFGGRQTTSLFTAPLDAMANKLTPESVQRYNVESGKLGYSLAQLMSGGRAVRVNDVEAMNKIIVAKQGDTINTIATKIAEARQLAERTMEVRSKSPNTPPGLKEVFNENLALVREVVPFTVDDINATINSKNKKLTFGQALSNKYTFAQTESAPSKKPKANPNEEIHEDANGNKAVMRNGKWVEVQ